MNVQYRAFHFCPRPDGKGLTVTKAPINITLRDALRQLTPNVDPKYFGFCFYPNDVQGYIRQGIARRCTWQEFIYSPLCRGAILTRSEIGHWIIPGCYDPHDALPNGRP